MSARGQFSPSKLPSLGFVAVVLVHVGLVAFLVWGFAQPPLDRVWELSHALKIGEFGTLRPRDRELLRATLKRHPRLADSLISRGTVGILSANDRGWLEKPEATLLVGANALPPCSMRVATRQGEAGFPLRVELSGTGWKRQLVLPDAEKAEVTFPSTRATADIIEVRFSTKTLEGGVHLAVHCGKATGQR
ncbi:MAG TPA: hypothetical protein VFU02_13015 [Polyangiaceae bacterium]|nr:hypothetical protein [Polyangiaceae bacterium]